MSQVPPPPSYPGSPQMGGYNPPGGAMPKGMSITALVLGILSFFTCCVAYNYVNLGMLVALAAVIVGFMARQKVARGEQGGGGMATAGLILGAVNLIIQIILLVVFLVFGVEMMNWAQKQAELNQPQDSTLTAPSDVTGGGVVDETPAPTTEPVP